MLPWSSINHKKAPKVAPTTRAVLYEYNILLRAQCISNVRRKWYFTCTMFWILRRHLKVRWKFFHRFKKFLEFGTFEKFVQYVLNNYGITLAFNEDYMLRWWWLWRWYSAPFTSPGRSMLGLLVSYKKFQLLLNNSKYSRLIRASN